MPNLPKPRRRRNNHHPTKPDLLRFLELAFPHAPERRLKLLILYALLHSPEPREKIIEQARRWDLTSGQADQLARGDTATGIPWYSVEATLTNSGANATIINLARELFHHIPTPQPPTSGAVEPTQQPTPEEPNHQLADKRKPDPMTTTSPTEFVKLMAAYRLWTGKRSFRKMATAIGDRYVPSTLAGIPNRTTLPSLDLVSAYIEACGGTSEDIETWQEAWRNLTLTNKDHHNRDNPYKS